MMNHGFPLAYFITWTVYGSFLQGDGRWWSKVQLGNQSPNHEIILLSDKHREVVINEIRHHCEIRQWRLWIANPRTNHIHVVVSAQSHTCENVRDQLKANCTRGLRRLDPRFSDRPVWTRGGNWRCIYSEEELEKAIQYAGEAQDRMEYK